MKLPVTEFMLNSAKPLIIGTRGILQACTIGVHGIYADLGEPSVDNNSETNGWLVGERRRFPNSGLLDEALYTPAVCTAK